jgi:hypothetical protein
MSLPQIVCVNCAILGQREAFQVKINGDQSVDDLKNVINTTALKVLGAHSLSLYKVGLPYSQDDYHEVSNAILDRSVRLEETQRLGYHLQLLQEVKDGFPDNLLHIVVVPPTSESKFQAVFLALILEYSRCPQWFRVHSKTQAPAVATVATVLSWWRKE